MASLSTITREENGNIILHIALDKAKVEEAKKAVLETLSLDMTIQGFRKGKAPKHIVAEHVSREKLQEETLRKLLPEAYITSVKEHNINPIINPKIHVDKLDDKTDWTFTATTCEMPKIDLGNYQERIKAITAKSKIILPGKEQKEPSFDEMMEAVIETVKTTIPDLLIEQEVDRLLAQTLDEIKKLGLSLEQYLTSTKKTPEVLRNDYAQKAEHDIKLEFALQQIAQGENITVEDKEIEEAIQKAKNPTEKSYLESNRYMLASILRQQKTLDFLKNL